MPLDLLSILTLLAVGVAAGAINAVAGGGTFISFPVLIMLGLPPVVANTTNKVAITFASLASVRAFLPEIRTLGARMWGYFAVAVAGSIFGSALLLWMNPDDFRALVPWLMLAATAVFVLGSGEVKCWIATALRPRDDVTASVAEQSRSLLSWAASLFGQFAIGIYGGFFAAGMGMLMMALYSASGMKNIHHMNGLKTLAGLGMNGVSAAIFLTTGLIDYQVAAVLLIGAWTGGHYGAHLSKRVSNAAMRRIIVAYGVMMTVWMFTR